MCARLILLALLFLPRPALTQSPADSLLQLLATAPADTHRVTLLVDLAWEINETGTDEADARLQEALALARRLKFSRGEAAALNGLGIVEEIRGNMSQAEQHYREALRIRRALDDKRDIASTLNNLGILSEWNGDFVQALKYHRENFSIMEELGDSLRMARAQENIAGAYLESGEYPEAQIALNSARAIYEKRQDDNVAQVYTKLGHIHFELDRYEEAYNWYAKSLRLRENRDDPVGLALALNDFANALDELDSSQTALSFYLRSLDLWTELNDSLRMAQLYTNLGDAHKHLKNFNQALEYLTIAEKIYVAHEDTPGLMEVYNSRGDVLRRLKRYEEAFAMTRKYYDIAQAINDEKYIQRAYKDLAALYAAVGDFEQAYRHRISYDEFRYARLDEQMSRSFARGEALYADQFVRDSVKQQRLLLRQNAAEIAQKTLRMQLLLAGALALALLVALLYNRNRLRRKANQQLSAQNEIIQKERERADALLRNILPQSTAQELKEKNRVLPVRYDSVTVLFTDFVGFTRIAEHMTPEALVAELDRCFRLFDAIAAAHRLEKIKTIGDAYMCAGGLPEPNNTHAEDAVSAALVMQAELERLMLENRAAGKPEFAMRIGIHTGPVVAGVVGMHKFAYDIWGDAVNTAARMEQSGELGRVNISAATWERVKDRFRCTFRGEIEAKNKGELAMYFVEGNIH